MILWYLARAAGITAFACLSLATGLGALTARNGRDIERRVVWQHAHRAAAFVGITLIGLHIVTLVADSYADVGLTGVLPFGSGYRPLAVTVGVLALYVLAGVAVTGMLRGRMARTAAGARRWRYVHASAYAAWSLSALHFLLAGSDTTTWWARSVLFGGVAVVAAGVAGRVVAPARPVSASATFVRPRPVETTGASR